MELTLAISLLSLFLSALAFIASFVGLTLFYGAKMSTHRVQMMSIDEMLAKNKKANRELQKIMNPGNEENEFLKPLREDDNEDDEEDGYSHMPNFRKNVRQ